MLYHATFTKRVRSIKRLGLLPGLRSIWARHDGSAYNVGKYVYAFECHTDAVLWAAKMGWTFFENSSSPQVAVLHINDPHSWEEDRNDPLGRSGAAGKWLRRRDPVAASCIVKVEVLTPSLVQTAIKTHRRRPDTLCWNSLVLHPMRR